MRVAPILLLLAGCATTSAGGPEQRRTDAPAAVEPAFGEGVVVLGMCPDEAIAAAGNPGPYVVRADPKKWPAGTFPPKIVAAQCEHPDDSVIELLFRNRVQYGTEAPVVFRVKFERGKAVSIDRVKAR